MPRLMHACFIWCFFPLNDVVMLMNAGTNQCLRWCTHVAIDACRLLLHVVGWCRLFNARRPQLMSADWCAQWLNSPDRYTQPTLTMTEPYAQATTKACSARETSTDQCAQATADTGDPWQMSHSRCRIYLADISYPKHKCLGWWCLSHDADVVQPMHTRHGSCM